MGCSICPEFGQGEVTSQWFALLPMFQNKILRLPAKRRQHHETARGQPSPPHTLLLNQDRGNSPTYHCKKQLR
eukprot:565771-Amphidinium_carterae.1